MYMSQCNGDLLVLKPSIDQNLDPWTVPRTVRKPRDALVDVYCLLWLQLQETAR